MREFLIVLGFMAGIGAGCAPDAPKADARSSQAVSVSVAAQTVTKAPDDLPDDLPALVTAQAPSFGEPQWGVSTSVDNITKVTYQYLTLNSAKTSWDGRPARLRWKCFNQARYFGADLIWPEGAHSIYSGSGREVWVDYIIDDGSFKNASFAANFRGDNLSLDKANAVVFLNAGRIQVRAIDGRQSGFNEAVFIAPDNRTPLDRFVAACKDPILKP